MPARKNPIQKGWDAYGKGGKAILVMLKDDIEKFAADRDGSKVAQHCHYARAYGQGGAIGRILKAAFGDTVKYSMPSTKNEAGDLKYTHGLMKIDAERWPKGQAFDLTGSNTWGLVSDGIVQQKSFNSKDFQQGLKEVVEPKKENPQGDEAELKAFEQVYNYINRQVKAHTELSPFLVDTIRQLEKAIEVRKAKPAFEPDF